MAACGVCGRPGKAGERCRACYLYWRTVGKDRPEERRAHHRRRRLERELEARRPRRSGWETDRPLVPSP